jgi:HAD superfamily hydrolase (TIGR01509 family)
VKRPDGKPSIVAVVFDLDGVLIDSEPIWETARRTFVQEHGGTYAESATRAVMGMNSPEWAKYLHDALGVALPPAQIESGVVALVAAAYERHVPLFPGAADAVRRLAQRWELGLASSSSRSLIELALSLTGLQTSFRAVVSSDEVGRGKPAPDVYLQAARLLEVAPEACAAIEDSANGIHSAHAAGMRVIAIPNEAFPPGPAAMNEADLVLDSIDELTPEAVLTRQ